MPKTLCIYHANCADGLGAAWAVHRALGNEVEFVAAKYGEQPQLSVPYKYHSTTEPCTDCMGTGYELGGGQFLDRDILIVDFSYPLATLRAMAAEARSVLVLDHHKTAQEDLAELPIPWVFNGKKESVEKVAPYKQWVASVDIGPLGSDAPDLAAIFDLNRSGAGIVWDYLHPGQPRPRIIDLVEDRDLWRFKFGDESRAFHTVLASYDWTDLSEMFQLFDFWNDDHEAMSGNPAAQSRSALSQAIGEGRAILRAQQQLVATAVAASRRTMRIAGHVVPVANVPPQLASDAGEILCQYGHGMMITDSGANLPCYTAPPPFSATYHDAVDLRRHFSLRSPKGGADVGQIAKNMAEWFNTQPEFTSRFRDTRWSGGGHPHAAGFDAPLDWEGEPSNHTELSREFMTRYPNIRAKLAE